MEFKDINILDFGNKYTMRGIVFSSPDEEHSVVIMLPQQITIKQIKDIIHPTFEEWHEMMNQLDSTNVEGIRDNERVILRKCQRNIDGRISWKVFRRDNYSCRYCGINHVPLTVDHIITWETGGATHIDNLLTACSKCNKKRGNMDYDQWLETSYYKEKSRRFLSEEVIRKNKDIVERLHLLPRVENIRKR